MSCSPATASLRLLILLALLTLPGLAVAQTPTEMGSGTGWLDCDGDGDLDLMFLTPVGDVVLYTYDAAADAFTDVSATALPEAIHQNNAAAAMGLALADFNNDGAVDAFVSMEGPNHLLINNGDGTFSATTRASGIKGAVLSSSVAVLDYDNDGWVDIYVGNYMGMPNRFYHNDGTDGEGVVHFTDVAPQLGMDIATGEGSSWTLGLAVADYDNDGNPDLYLANDYNGLDDLGGLKPGRNVLYRNNGDGTFTDVSAASGADNAGWAMGVAFGDYNRDGNLDIFLANFWEDALLRNNGDGTFTEVTRETGLITDAPGEWHYNGWGTSFIDFDNDGDLDIHVANGYILNDQGQVINEPNQLWENTGVNADGSVHFRDIATQAGLDDPGDGRGAAYGDFNGDGLIDILLLNNGFLADDQIIPRPKRMLSVNQGDGTFRDLARSYGLRSDFADGPKLSGYRDYTGNHWVEVLPVGREGNLSAVGARVIVKAGGKTWIQDDGAASYCSSSSPYRHFGLGDAPTIDEILVRFSDGTWARETDVAVDQVLTVLEPEVTPVRLLSFGLASTAEGVRIRWSYRDDGDAAAFTVKRTLNGDTSVVGEGIAAADGRGEFLDTGAPAHRTVVYTLESVLRDGSREVLRTQAFRFEPPVGLVLGRSFPNPFQSATTIPILGAPGGAAMEIGIFDASGRKIRTLRRAAASGESSVRWDGRDEAGRPVPGGTYFYRLKGSGAEHTLKMIKQP